MPISSHPRRWPALLLTLALAGCGTTAEDRARVTTLTIAATATPTPAGPAIDAESAAGVAETARLEVGTAPVTAVAWLPDGATIIAGDEAGVVRRIRVVSRKAVDLGDDGEPIRAVTATGDRVAWGGEAGVVRAIGGTTGGGAARDVADAPRGVFSLASTADGELAAGTGAGTVLVFGRERYTLEGLGRGVDGVAYSPNGRRLAAISRTGEGAVFERTRELIRFGYVDGERGGEMRAVAWLDPNRIGTVSEDGRLRVYQVHDGRRAMTLRRRAGGLRALATLPRTGVVASGGDAGTVAVHAGNALSVAAKVRIGSPVHHLAFSPDGSRLAVAAADGSVRLVGPPKGR